jgi:hypothetical protein
MVLGTFYNIWTHFHWASHTMAHLEPGPFIKYSKRELNMFGDSHVQSLGLFKHLDIASALPCLWSGRIYYYQTSINFNLPGYPAYLVL